MFSYSDSAFCVRHFRKFAELYLREIALYEANISPAIALFFLKPGQKLPLI